MSEITLTSRFVLEKFGGPFPGYLSLWDKQTKQTQFFATGELDKLDAVVAELAPKYDLYLALGAQAARLPHDKRGNADTVCAVPGFFGDIDFANSKDSAKKYPPDEAAALKVLATFPLKPTTIIRTGNGLHAHWDLEKPLLVETPGDREDAKSVWKDFQRSLQRCFAANGYDIDSVGDLTRLYRIPGTFNHKSSPPKTVEIISHE